MKPSSSFGKQILTHPAANDNALARIARDVRRTAFGWRHAQTVASFVDGRRQVLAAYDELRERTRAEGDSVALSGAYRETLTRHAVLLKQAAAFRARPDDFASLLAQRGGIGRKDLDAFEELHARAHRHRRAATMRHVHRIKRETEQQGVEPEMRQEETASDYHDWRRENDRLTTAGEAILSDMEAYGPHLDNILIGETRMNWALLNMSRAIRRDDEAISKEAIAAEELLAQPETPEEREQQAEREALKFRRLQSAVDDAATQEEREAALKEFDDYVERHSDSPSEEEHEGRSISRSWSIRALSSSNNPPVNHATAVRAPGRRQVVHRPDPRAREHAQAHPRALPRLAEARKQAAAVLTRVQTGEAVAPAWKERAPLEAVLAQDLRHLPARAPDAAVARELLC